jgi:hypothetical protein
MRKISFKFSLLIGLVLTVGLTSVFGFGTDTKRPKNTGIVTVKTSPVAYPVKIDGQYVGMSGVAKEAEFYVAPGAHTVEVEFPDGKKFNKSIDVIKDRKNCICLSYVETTVKKNCPYDVRVDGPDKVTEGDLITFAAFNSVAGVATPLNYRWRVFPETAKITSGQGTSAITVDTTGLGNQTVRAELDVWDDVYADKCRQKNQATTEIEPIPEPEPRKPFMCDEFETRAFDDDKARFDNCVIQMNNIPDSQLYVIIYPGTDKISTTRNTFEKLSKRTLDYFVRTRGVDPRRIQIVRWGSRPRTTYQIWIVPPGATPPVPQ